MDNQNVEYKRNRGNWGGIVLIVIGLFLFLQNMHLAIPGWIFSWKTLLIVIGLVFGAKQNFRGGPWIVMVLVGGIFLAQDILPWSFNVHRYGWPLILVVIGVYMLTKRPYHRRSSAVSVPDQEKWSAGPYQQHPPTATGEDYIDATAVFGSADRIVLSKNLQGGDLTAVFGGCEINLMQADFNGTISLEATAIFGGVELIVPANWEVKVEVNTIFGGVDDKRSLALTTPNSGKTLIIKGTCVFGGMEIKSY
jgi:predicted membrane protein